MSTISPAAVLLLELRKALRVNYGWLETRQNNQQNMIRGAFYVRRMIKCEGTRAPTLGQNNW